MENKKKHSRLILYMGAAVLAISYSQFIIPDALINFTTLTIFNTAFMLGIVLISEWTTRRIKQESLLTEIFKNKKTFLLFLVASTLGGLILDLICKWLANLWFYAFFTPQKYALLFIGGFALYWLMITESYLAIKMLLDKLKHGRRKITKSYKKERGVNIGIGLCGIVLLSAGLLLAIFEYRSRTSCFFNLSIPIDCKINFIFILMIFLGVWFLLEFLEHYLKRTSLSKNILHGYFTPIIAIIICSFMLAFIMETQNLFYNYWIYFNWPLQHVLILKLPIMMVLAWPLHYIFFLSLLCTISKDLSKSIWRGDTIK